MQDIYFDSRYGALYEKAEDGEARTFVYSGKEGRAVHNFILRKVPIECGEEYFDAVTPYGYGGPVIEEVAQGYTREELVRAFAFAFEAYAMENKIVCEFVRFHPIIKNADDFGALYRAEYIRDTLATSLEGEDPVGEEFSKSCRKNIRRALNKGITYRVTESVENLDTFKKIYYSTMDRNHAGEFYYFDDGYFDKCLEYFKENTLLVEAIYEDRTIAAGFYFVFGDMIHIHLSGTLSEYLWLSPAYILRYAIVEWGKERGYKLVHHGGGRSNSEEDSLFLFKKQFAQNTQLKFYVGKKIWNERAYGELVKIAAPDAESDFFPAYRKPIMRHEE